MLHHMLRAAAQRAFSVLDPYFQYVTMLLHGDGTNGAQNNTFVDSSTNNFTITRNGNTTQGTFTPYGSNWSNYLNNESANNSYLSVASSASFAYSTADFTAECWVFMTAVPSADAGIIEQRPASTNGNYLMIGVDSSSRLFVYINSAYRISPSSGTAISANTWNHIAYSRSSGTATLYLNGASIGSWSDTINYGNQPVGIGYQAFAGAGNKYFPGYISNVRIVKGTAVYTGAFTPSTAPLTAITNTQLLTCQSNRYIDNSTNAATISVTGSPSVQRFSPFSPTTAYSTSVIGGSGYFDGSGDYLSAANNTAFNLNSVSFTVECWVYWNSLSGEQNIVEQFTPASGPGWTLYKFNAGTIDFYGGTGSINSGVTPVAGQWYHLAISRDNSTGTTSFYVNGTRTATATFGVASTAATELLVGVRKSGTTWFNGYMEDLRIVKGSYVYNPTATTITVPTAPLTAITNTQLLLSYTNAGILDNAMMNDLETVGNAQISTSVKKYGTGSMYFDGSGDYLVAPNAQNLFSFGTGDFTIECWVYYNSIGADQGIIDCRAPGDGLANWILNVQSGGVVDFIYGATRLRTAGLFSTGSWVHIAVTRASGTIRIFVNGTNSASATYTSAIDSRATVPNIGRAIDPAYMNGYIDDLRITKGVARYTTTFTPPTAAFPNN